MIFYQKRMEGASLSLPAFRVYDRGQRERPYFP